MGSLPIVCQCAPSIRAVTVAVGPNSAAGGDRRSDESTGESDMTKILLVQGPNLSFLGRREPAIYGTTTPAELDVLLQSHAKKHDYALDIFYSNIEGEAINRIYQAVDEGFEGLVMNP